MIDFEDAVRIALENVEKLVKGAKNPVPEEALLSSDGKFYEVTVSYDLDGPGAFDTLNPSSKDASNLLTLAAIMGRRKEYKVFLINSENGNFGGFRRYKEG
ncbi:hypothetical protein [Rhodospirillum rubrum]|uniref:hypothetical protein n=1 Tax=Rhodospirillum rubrum TaxID=1085 RepID=UPI0011D1E580|nr:hypothetical protein [Rhodospirillum rubrum]QXG80655.1 hypothetical protein KUL73_00785 [Rhodospirillum rubrum]